MRMSYVVLICGVYSLVAVPAMEDLKGLHKTFWGTTKKRENKN